MRLRDCRRRSLEVGIRGFTPVVINVDDVVVLPFLFHEVVHVVGVTVLLFQWETF